MPVETKGSRRLVYYPWRYELVLNSQNKGLHLLTPRPVHELPSLNHLTQSLPRIFFLFHNVPDCIVLPHLLLLKNYGPLKSIPLLSLIYILNLHLPT